MRVLQVLLLLFFHVLTPIYALHESDAGVVDWYKQYIGVPAYEAPATAPRFTTTKDGEDVVLTATKSNVLAALNSTDGSIVWRYVFDAEDTLLGFHQSGDNVITLSGPGGAITRSFALSTGHLLAERRLHPASTGILVEPRDFGKAIASATTQQSIYTLTNGHTITHLSPSLQPLWTWSSPDQGSLTTYTSLLVVDGTVYAVGLSASFASYTIHVTSLAASTGAVVASTGIPSSISNPTTGVFAFASSPSEAHVVWLDASAQTVVSLALTPTLENAKPLKLKGERVTALFDINPERPVLVAHTEKGSSHLLEISSSGEPSLGKTLGGVDDASSYATTPGTGAVARTSWTPSQGSPSSYRLEYGQHTVALPTDEVPAHIALAKSGEGALVTTASGTVVMYAGAREAWRREEGLPGTTVAEFVELPERSVVVGDGVGGRKGEGFGQRVGRHLVMLQDLPRYVISFVHRFATGSYATAVTPTSPTSSSSISSREEGLFRDAFGFRQVIVAASPHGKVFGLDSSNGAILWSRVLGASASAEEGWKRGMYEPKRIFTLKSVNEGGAAEVVVVAQRRTRDEKTETVAVHLNALTGALVGETVLFEGPVKDAFLIDAVKDDKFVIVLDEELKVHFYPSTPSALRTFASLHTSLSFPLASGSHTHLAGYAFTLKGEHWQAHATWTLPFRPQERVVGVVPPTASKGPVASLGRVVGNRTTLYKYLNAGLVTVLTFSSSSLEKGARCGVYLVDGTKGSVVHQTKLEVSVEGTCGDVKTALTENWFVYTWFDARERGWRVGSVEMYEGRGVDSKTSSSDMSSYDPASVDVRIFEESWVFPTAVSAVGFTSTKFGISARDFVVATKTGKIQTFPRRVLNPRRPHGKPSAEEAEEGLFAYDPIAYDDARRVVSHYYDVANVQKIITSPALLESTSLVLALGLDAFLTRVAPSGTFDVLSESFNKVQLVATVVGLVGAIGVVRPMVRRKRERERWYY